MKTRSLFRWLFVAIPLGFPAVLSAQVPALLNCQGRVSIGGTNYDGTGAFQFALVNGTGTATFWSNGASAVSLEVNKGLYSVLLGDTNVADMAALSASVFTNGDVRLRVAFAPQGQTPQRLSPDQRIASVGYAFTAGGLNDGTWDVKTGDVLDGEGQTHSNLLVFSSAGDWRLAFLPSGEIHARGNLSTEGDIYADGALEAAQVDTSGEIAVNGDGQQQIRLASNGTIWARGDIQLGGNANFDGSLDIEDETLLHSNLWVEGQIGVSSNFNADGNVRIGGTLEVENDIMADNVAGISNLAVQTLTVAGKPVPTAEVETRIVFGTVMGGTPRFPAYGFTLQTNAMAGVGTLWWNHGVLQDDRKTIVCADAVDSGVFPVPRYVLYAGKIRWATNCASIGGTTHLTLEQTAFDLAVGTNATMELDPSLANIYRVTFDVPFQDPPTVIVSGEDDNAPDTRRALYSFVKLEGPPANAVSNSSFTVVHGLENSFDNLNEPFYPFSPITWHFIAVGR